VDHNGCNAGWADAMARVLKSKKPKKSRSIILSKAKKLNESAKSVIEKETSFEVSSLNEQHPRRKVCNSSVVRV
jgi:Rrp15p.